MIGSIAIDFRPEDGAARRILETIEAEGFALRGLRLIPCPNQERSTLQLDLCASRPGLALDRLEHQLAALEATVAVIHRATGHRPTASAHQRRRNMTMSLAVSRSFE